MTTADVSKEIRRTILSVNPATGETLRSFDPMSRAEITRRIDLADSVFRQYRHIPFADRARWMKHAADVLERGEKRYAYIMTSEMGKTIASARAEVAKCAWVCRYYADNAERMLADEVIPTEASRSFVRYQPLGVVLAIMPWNFPFWQVFRFAVPALMAGNVGLLKHASNVPQCALAIEEIFLEAGFPDGSFQALLMDVADVPLVLDDPRVVAATLTGSVRAGSVVASHAGRQVKKTVLELGGSDPFIVTPNADLEAAVQTAVTARLINNGQSCIAAKRFLIAEPIAQEFRKRFVQAVEAVKVGDPMDESTQLGPLATAGILEELDDQVQRSVGSGARLLTGGTRLDGPGNFYTPTVLADIPESAAAFSEELFGPVASLFTYRTREEAIELANATVFGLGASVWTKDQQEADWFVDRIEAGMVFVNGMVASDPRLPFGGIKQSGYGRELATIGMREFLNIKTVWMK
ncbi:MAG: NAD-dependent succinate-semialdehyde dehydrogenase [Candidatus Korobacteraceae bacterium]